MRLFERSGSVRNMCMRRKLPPSDMSMGQVNKKHWVMPQPPTALPMMPDERVGAFVNENARGSGAELISTRSNTNEQWPIAIIQNL